MATPVEGTQFSEGPPRFLVDEMLGRLAKWLRALGYDAVWERGVPDADLVDRAEREGRILLTRDTLLMERRPVSRGRVMAVLVRPDRLPEQLVQLRVDLGLVRLPSPRCLTCNAGLLPLPREEASAFVPQYVAQTQSCFTRCPVCRRLYWRATHWKAMEGVMDAAGFGESSPDADGDSGWDVGAGP
jgi:uncharacterized protein with PIN domain